MNEWLAHYVSGYPAMLHVFPIIGVPVLIFAAINFVWGRFKKQPP